MAMSHVELYSDKESLMCWKRQFIIITTFKIIRLKNHEEKGFECHQEWGRSCEQEN